MYTVHYLRASNALRSWYLKSCVFLQSFLEAALAESQVPEMLGKHREYDIVKSCF